MMTFSTILAQAVTGTSSQDIPFSPPLLSLIVFAPIIGGLILLIFPKLDTVLARILGLFFSLSTLVMGTGAAIIVLELFGTAPIIKTAKFMSPYKLVENGEIVSSLGINYHLGIDGISILLVLLTGIIAPMCLLASWKIKKANLFNALMLLTQGAALGVFLTLNFFHWFIFWELSLFPVFFLIKIWGGPNATRAAYQFVIYTLGGSAFMLLSFAAIYAATGQLGFNILPSYVGIEGSLNEKLAAFGSTVPMLVFWGILVGLAVKVPLFPLHTWLPITYAEAPVGVSMFLTAILSKMGVYAVHRILWPIFPEQLKTASPYLIWLALAGIVLGAYAAMRQTDLKRMIAYSSINHLNYCLLAVFAAFGATHATQAAADAAFSGTLLQMFNHGLSAAALFFCIGVLEDRSGVRGLNDFGGVRKVAPVFAALCGISMFSSLGLPGLNGFVSEFLIFRGVFELMPWAAVIACLGLLGTAIFLLNFWQKVFHGPIKNNTSKITDLSPREILVLGPVVILMFVIGIWPQFIINLFKAKLDLGH
ncbi:MAG: NADH-quinone oxidoreductase subunit M [Puniceicoccales bacterium]|jgi:NADH-quinone oxidoreductase subunit M|nr:NADH-quinone oxidoreductase subunit M [Puniceicoccales bacterium]